MVVVMVVVVVVVVMVVVVVVVVVVMVVEMGMTGPARFFKKKIPDAATVGT